MFNRCAQLSSLRRPPRRPRERARVPRVPIDARLARGSQEDGTAVVLLDPFTPARQRFAEEALQASLASVQASFFEATEADIFRPATCVCRVCLRSPYACHGRLISWS